MDRDRLQIGFSEHHGDVVFAAEARGLKARKILAILDDHYRGDLSSLVALDIGCSAGNTTRIYATRFKRVVGIDIDEPAIKHAIKHNASPNLQYHVMNSEELTFPSGSFDVVICNHVYEHVPDASSMLNEIYRLLKPEGICYFGAGNRLSWREPHYRLPLLSVIPRPCAHVYLRMSRRGEFYYEKHLTYWQLKRLVSRFEVIDYTLTVVRHPERFFASDMLQPGSAKQRLALGMLNLAYWLCPTYLWLLKKKA